MTKYIFIFTFILLTYVTFSQEETHCDCQTDDYLMVGLIFNKTHESIWLKGLSIRYNHWQNRRINYEINYHTSALGSNLFNKDEFYNSINIGLDYVVFDLKYIQLAFGVKSGFQNSYIYRTNINSFTLSPEFSTFILGQLINLKLGYNFLLTNNTKTENQYYIQIQLNIPIGFHRNVE